MQTSPYSIRRPCLHFVSIEKAFCDAARKVSITELEEKLGIEDEQRELLTSISRLEELQKSPTRATGVHQALGAVSLARPIPAPFTAQPAAPSAHVPGTHQYRRSSIMGGVCGRKRGRGIERRVI